MTGSSRRAGAPSGKRAFSLIEAAIVLGIIGLVIGGIWVAASTTQKNVRVNRMVEALIFIRQKYVELYKDQDSQTYQDATALMITSGGIPADLHDATKAWTPWGTPLTVYIGPGCTNTDRLRVFIDSPDTQTCINLVRNMFQSNNGQPTGNGMISQIWFANEDVYLSTGSNGATPALAYSYAQAHCPLNTQLGFYFCKP